MFRLTFLALAALFVVAASTSHGNTTGTIQAKKYYVVNEDRSFVGAMLGCRQAGLRLASITNATEQLLLQVAIDNNNLINLSGYWIGGALEAYETYTYYWIETGAEFIYKNWGYSQPQHDRRLLRSGLCVRAGNSYLVEEPYQWESINCNSKLYYICEES
ncbi:hypothetical protein ABEB36_004523 [Hypothenemus hampei]|uniref:C-type lectin domain-containing protein n=1 Tax=Hypothenemus hampei TaxID=57062 RepID=A0ABD1F6A0_HYPHA